jgi:hypothetical protein
MPDGKPEAVFALEMSDSSGTGYKCRLAIPSLQDHAGTQSKTPSRAFGILDGRHDTNKPVLALVGASRNQGSKVPSGFQGSMTRVQRLSTDTRNFMKQVVYIAV